MTTSVPEDGLALRCVGLAMKFDRAPGKAPLFSVPSLDLQEGCILCITGPSGAGKSTLLYILSGLLRPTSGSVKWGGADIATMPDASLDTFRRRQFGIVFQNFHLLGELSPLDNVILPGRFESFGITAAQRRHALDLLEALAVPTSCRFARQLSRGEQQRVALARALFFEPQVLFADEPTASLDADATTRLIDALFARTQARRRSLVIVSHDQQVIERCPRILRIEQGRLSERSGLAAAS